MKRPLKPDEVRVWGMVASTVHPLPGRGVPKAKDSPPPCGEGSGVGAPTASSVREAIKAPKVRKSAPTPPHPTLSPQGGEGSKDIEPNRRHRIVRAREEIGARLDLHGLTQDKARVVLEAFLHRAYADGSRAVLVITGKGVQGDGILKRVTPGWLAAPHLSHIVAGISDAARHHGGAGALYVALKRKPRA